MSNSEIIELMIYPIKQFILLIAQLTISSGTLLGYVSIGLILTLIFSFVFRRSVSLGSKGGHKSEEGIEYGD